MPSARKKTTSRSTSAATASTTTPMTTFPPGDCAAGLPASESFHDVTFAEFKRLSVTIEGLPYPLKHGKVDMERSRLFETGMRSVGGQLAHSQHQATLQKIGTSVLSAAGNGLPIGQYLDKTSAPNEPLFTDVKLRDVYEFVQRPQARLKGSKTPVKLDLSDQAKADLLANQPVLVTLRRGGRMQLLRLLPQIAESSVPLFSDYHVGTVDDFIRDPHLTASDGSQLRISLKARELKELSESGSTSIAVGRRKIRLRAAARSAGAGNGPIIAYRMDNGGYASDNIETNDSGGGKKPPGTPRPTPTPAPPPPPSTGQTPTTAQPAGGGTQRPPRQSNLQLALYLPWRNRWILKGYSRGQLLHSLALGPQEETTIEISTWDRRKRTFEDSAKSEFEQTSEFTETSKDVQTIAREITNQNNFGASVSAEIGFKIEVVDVSATTGFNASTAVTESSKNNLEILRESVTKATNKLNLQRETKISEATETDTESKVTRKIRNPNLCHTLTLNYYEVLAHYEIVTEMIKEDARLCIFDSNPLGLDEFDYRNIRYYESTLRRVLLVPELADGFAAARKLVSQEMLCEARARNDACSAVQAAVALPSDDPGAQLLQDQLKRIAQTAATLRSAAIGCTPQPSALMIFVPWPIFTLTIQDKTSLQRYMYNRRASSIAPHLFDVISQLQPDAITPADVQTVTEALSGVSLSSISTAAISMDTDAMYNTLRDDLAIPPVPVVFTDIPGDAYAVDDAGLTAQLNTFLHAVRDAAQNTKLAAGVAAMNANQAAVKYDYSNKELAEALESQEALTQHLNRYRNYYRTCILTLMPFPDSFHERLTMLPMVERRVLGFDANEVALPIKPNSDARATELYRTLVTENEELVSMRTTQDVTLPTSGVHLETRLGECCSCESYIEDLRKLDIAMKEVEIDLKKQLLEQQKLETQRYSARLAAEELGDPIHRPAEIRVETTPALPQTPTPPNP